MEPKCNKCGRQLVILCRAWLDPGPYKPLEMGQYRYYVAGPDDKDRGNKSVQEDSVISQRPFCETCEEPPFSAFTEEEEEELRTRMST